MALLIIISLVACSDKPAPPTGVAGFSFPAIPGLDFSQWDPPRLGRDYDPGSFEGLGALDISVSSTGNKAYLVTASGLMETDLTPEDLVGLYRHRIVHPSWSLIGKGAGDTAAWFTWTVEDATGSQWYGSLVAVRAGDGWQNISFALHSSESR